MRNNPNAMQNTNTWRKREIEIGRMTIQENQMRATVTAEAEKCAHITENLIKYTNEYKM